MRSLRWVSAWTGCALRLSGIADWVLGRLLGAREVTFRTHDPKSKSGGRDLPNPLRIDAYIVQRFL
jgi:hypothetical protein